MVHGREGTERYPVYVAPRFGPFCVLLHEKNNMLLCVKNLVNIYLLNVLIWKL